MFRVSTCPPYKTLDGGYSDFGFTERDCFAEFTLKEVEGLATTDCVADACLLGFPAFSVYHENGDASRTCFLEFETACAVLSDWDISGEHARTIQ